MLGKDHELGDGLDDAEPSWCGHGERTLAPSSSDAVEACASEDGEWSVFRVMELLRKDGLPIGFLRLFCCIE